MLKGYFTTEELRTRYPLSMDIQSPVDLKKLSAEQIKNLAQEQREYLIEVCARNGGHLAPGLGVIELTLALHRVFESPKDKIVWDIGHQSYPHKLVTGRFESLQGLRKEHGVSGFCRREESPHDIFGAGHAGTSISAAIGVGEGHRRNKDSHKVIAVIGDAGLTAGMAYEGLHQDVRFKKNLIVILNDNEMSIAPNVGAINAMLSKKMSSPFLHRIQDELKAMAARVPVVGEELVESLSRLKHSIKNLIVPTVMFEGMGFRYYGPMDGHDYEALVELLENVKQINQPVLIHIVTEKGRGYAPAIADKETFHGCGPYEKESGKIVSKPGEAPGYNKVYAKTVALLTKTDPKVVAITAAMPSGTGLGVVQKETPDQFYDVGISEQHAVTFAAGLATEGIKPHVGIYSTFMQRAYDQVIHDVCIQNLDVKMGLDRAGFVGADGATHNGCYDIAFMRAIPNLAVCAPKDELELQELVVAMNKHQGPSCVRYPRGSGVGMPLYKSLDEIPEIEWGSSEIIYFSGASTTIEDETYERKNIPAEWVERLVKSQKAPLDFIFVACGTMVLQALKAAKELKKESLHSIVVNARFIKPLDEKLMRRLLNLSKNIITIEEHVLMGGFGSAVMEFYQRNDLLQDLRIKCLGIPDRFFEQASIDSLYKQAGLDIESIKAAARKIVSSSAEGMGSGRLSASRLPGT